MQRVNRSWLTPGDVANVAYHAGNVCPLLPPSVCSHVCAWIGLNAKDLMRGDSEFKLIIKISE